MFLRNCDMGNQVKEAARAYRVYYSKTTDSEDDYLVDHSIIMYLVDPEGEFVTFYGKNFTAEQLAGNIWDKVVGWNAAHPPGSA
jgi:protein SCO1/2